MLLLAMAGSTHAELVLKNTNRFSVVPNVFTTSGKTVFYSGGSETGDKTGGEVIVYSPDDFTPKTFRIGVAEYQIGSYEEEAIVTLTGMNVFPESVDGRKNYDAYSRWEASSQEEMIDKLGSSYYVAFTDPMGNPACYYVWGSFMYKNIFGEQYPSSWYALIDGMVYQISTYNDFYSPAYDEESAVWTRTSEDIETYLRGCIYLTLYLDGMVSNYGNDNFNAVYITQNLFNNDDKWEYVLPEYGPLSYRPYNINDIIDNGDGTVTLKRSVDARTPLIGYAVYNEDGTKLYSIKNEDSKGGLHVYLDGNRVFYSTREGDYNCIYELNKETGDIDLVEKVQAKDERKLGASHGIVTVDIDAEQAGGEVVVSTTDGKVIANKKVGIGQAQINDQPLPAGIYVVSLLKDGRVVESEKYLVQ